MQKEFINRLLNILQNSACKKVFLHEKYIVNNLTKEYKKNILFATRKDKKYENNV